MKGVTMEFDSTVIIEYLEPFIMVCGVGFCLATLVSLLGYGIHKAVMLLHV